MNANLPRVINARILIVEDERIIAKDIEQTMRALGYHVVGIADSAGEAVRRAIEEAPDLILMDIHLRGETDGIEAARRIQEELQVPIVFLTAFADERTLLRAKQTAPYGYVLKPFDDRDLQVATMMALCKHRAVLELDQKVQARTEELLRSEARYREMALLSELGVFALRTPDLQPVLDRAVEVVAETLGVELCQITELVPDGTALRMRAGRGWQEGQVGAATVGADLHSQAGFTLLGSAPVMVEDLSTETRFSPPALLLEHGVTSGATVVIWSPGDERPYGVLGAYSRTHRIFTESEATFLQAVGNLIGTTVARAKADRLRWLAERAAEEERTRAEHAQAALRSRDEFLSIASHELKTPLTALQLQLQSLVSRGASLSDAVRAKVERAVKSTERLAVLVESLIDVSRLSSGRIELNREDVVLQEIAEAVLRRLAAAAHKARCEVRLIDQSGGPLPGHWDRDRVSEMLASLLSNAFKYAPGQPVEVTLRRDGDHAELEVTDRGPGISEENVDRIFQRFERASSIRNYGGLGLGLYVSRELARAHGGDLGLRTTLGAGASFILRLPLTSVPAGDSAKKVVLQ